MGYLDALRQNRPAAAEVEWDERRTPSVPLPTNDGPDGSDIPASPPAGAASPADRCAAPGCPALIDRFGADGLGYCAQHTPPDGAAPRGVSTCEESEESEERSVPVAPCEESEESEERSVPVAPCPRCKRLSREAGEVLAAVRRHPATPPALKSLPDDRLLVLIKWVLVRVTDPPLP